MRDPRHIDEFVVTHYICSRPDLSLIAKHIGVNKQSMPSGDHDARPVVLSIAHRHRSFVLHRFRSVWRSGSALHSAHNRRHYKEFYLDCWEANVGVTFGSVNVAY